MLRVSVAGNYSQCGSRDKLQLFLLLFLQHPWWNSEFTESWLFSFYWQRNCWLNYPQGSCVNYVHRSGERRWQKINIQQHWKKRKKEKFTSADFAFSPPTPLKFGRWQSPPGPRQTISSATPYSSQKHPQPSIFRRHDQTSLALDSWVTSSLIYHISTLWENPMILYATLTHCLMRKLLGQVHGNICELIKVWNSFSQETRASSIMLSNVYWEFMPFILSKLPITVVIGRHYWEYILNSVTEFCYSLRTALRHGHPRMSGNWPEGVRVGAGSHPNPSCLTLEPTLLADLFVFAFLVWEFWAWRRKRECSKENGKAVNSSQSWLWSAQLV